LERHPAWLARSGVPLASGVWHGIVGTFITQQKATAAVLGESSGQQPFDFFFIPVCVPGD